MPPASPAPPRSLAVLNRAIRDCVDARARGEEPAEEYEQLLVEWAAAIRSRITKAA